MEGASGAQGGATRAPVAKLRKVAHTYFYEKCLCGRWGQHGRCPLADGAQALAVPGRLKQYFSHTTIVPKKAANVRPTEHLKTAGQLQC